MCGCVLVSFFFILMSPVLTRSFLFPYTTLFRSAMIDMIVDKRLLGAGDDLVMMSAIGKHLEDGQDEEQAIADGAMERVRPVRSEEHTSELQSRGHLVCRLLLEKKNVNRQIVTRV